MAVYKLSEDASQELINIYEYSLINFGEDQADQYYISLYETFELLAEQPDLGRKFHEFHRHEHKRHTLFYKKTDYGILILYILHESENVDDKLN